MELRMFFKDETIIEVFENNQDLFDVCAVLENYNIRWEFV